VAIVQVEEVTVVDAEIGDDHLVHVRQMRKHVALTPTEALQLSQELAEAAVSARRLLGEQAERERGRIAQQGASGVDRALESGGPRIWGHFGFFEEGSVKGGFDG